ncbi:MAG: anti-sigma factor [Phycisphaerales bacterium]|nr:anti-sigma factor [Phycisphaerales bacterium]
MSETHNPHNDHRDDDQMIDRMLGQSESSDSFNSEDLTNEMEFAAATIDVAAAMVDPVELPEGLIERLKLSVDDYPVQEPVDQSIPISQYQAADFGIDTTSSNWVPWMVAAASVLITTVLILMPRNASQVPDLDSQRLALIDNTPESELIRWDWISTGDEAVAGDVIGDVVWSDTLNKGYMRISGLAINDPSLEQYQLWIFDSTRPSGALPQFGEGLLTQRPVDGGVFDINAEGEVIIEIDAKLFIREAAAFAITIEPPGGVVVSDRSRVPLLALAP